MSAPLRSPDHDVDPFASVRAIEAVATREKEVQVDMVVVTVENASDFT